MSKKQRQQKRLRRQEYPDAVDLEDVKPEPAAEVDDSPALPRPAARAPQTPVSRNCPYRVGDIVVTKDTAKNGNGESRAGTVVWISGDRVTVLDALGFLHRVPFYEVYPG